MPITPLPEELAARLGSAELTYPEVGQTAGMLPPGYHHLRCSEVVGSGEDLFAAAARGLLGRHVQLTRRTARVGVIAEGAARQRGGAGRGSRAGAHQRTVPGRLRGR